MAKPMSMLCIYRVKQGKEDEFKGLLKKHWPALNAAGLVSPQPARILRGEGKDGGVLFIETFQWKDEKASDTAHQTPQVMQVWEPMGALAEGMEFIRVEPAQI